MEKRTKNSISSYLNKLATVTKDATALAEEWSDMSKIDSKTDDDGKLIPP